MIVSITYESGNHFNCQLFKTVDEAYTFLYGFKDDLLEHSNMLSIRNKHTFRAMMEIYDPLTFDSVNPLLGSRVTVRKHKL